MHRLLLALALLLAGPVAPGAAATPDPLLEAGRAIYERGLLPSGEPLRAIREGIEISGSAVACMQCHRRSGTGTTEGTSPVPTINAAALFAPHQPLGHQPRMAPGVALAQSPFAARPPYTDDTLARALRDGVAPDGRSFGFLMPRYPLDDDALAALLAYLRTLGETDAPGVAGRLVHFATVIAPDTEPARRRQMLDVLRACFREQYPEQFVDPRGRVKPGDRLAWRLHAWQLDGAPETWGDQLAARYAQQPVFALISGLAGEQWEPVHQWCEGNRVPCLFPNTDLPGAADDAVYSFYLYRGVYLEADALAQHLAGEHEKLGLRHLLQVVRPGTASEPAAARLADALGTTGLTLETRAADDTLAARLAQLGPHDALVLWLRADDLKALALKLPAPPAAGLVVVSGSLGGADRPPLPAKWKRELRIVYPFDPPLRWDNRMTFNLRPWLKRNGVVRGDERLQGNTLTACNFLVSGIARLQGRFQRDLLLESAEIGLEGNQAAPSAFPRFSLGPNQRFGSKGAFIVKFESADSDRLVRESDWLVP